MSCLTAVPPAREDYRHEPAYDSGFLEVGTIHRLHYEQYGRPDGKPVVFLHGGPGGSTSIGSTVFFDPAVYRVVLFDQRGAGRSEPAVELRENTSAHLVADIEELRLHLGIDKWHTVFGGSWGSTLALLYAEAHPASVGCLVLRGIFLATDAEFEAAGGPNWNARLFPDIYDDWVAGVPAEYRGSPADIVRGYYKLITSGDEKVSRQALRDFARNGMAPSAIDWDPNDADPFAKLDDEPYLRAHGFLETHYIVHRAFVEPDQIMRNIDTIKHIPCTIVNGRYDMITPPRTAYELHKAWPGSELFLIPGCGHSVKGQGLRSKLIETCDRYGKKDFHLSSEKNGAS